MRMASELIRPKVVSFLDQMLRVGGGTLRVEEVTIGEGSPVIGKTLASLEVEEIEGTLLLALSRPDLKDSEFKPAPDTVLGAGMSLIVMTDVAGREILERRLQLNGS
jgi:voltage-gated potassium channel